MNISKFSDYAYRTLIYLAKNRDKLCTVEELSKDLYISEHHLKKIVHKLGKTEYVISIKGRNGGIKLGLEPSEINLRSVLNITEENLTLIECFSRGQCTCEKSGSCKLKIIINSSLNSFMKELSNYTLADLL